MTIPACLASGHTISGPLPSWNAWPASPAVCSTSTSTITASARCARAPSPVTAPSLPSTTWQCCRAAA